MQSLIIMTAALPSLLLNERKQQGKEMQELHQFPVSVLCSRFIKLILGTFKFITKCVVCIIIADFLKNLSLLGMFLRYASLTFIQ